MLRGVVLSGTGVGLRDIPGPPVIAKTGTAEFDRDGKRLTHAWMIAGYGDLAVCAFVDVGRPAPALPARCSSSSCGGRSPADGVPPTDRTWPPGAGAGP